MEQIKNVLAKNLQKDKLKGINDVATVTVISRYAA